MGNWRNRPPRGPYNRHRHYYYDSELSNEDLQDNVPPWEKKFCYAIGSVPWRKVVDTKYIMSHHSNVMNWDDSAVKDTFITAKRRFWDEMNGLDCDTSTPPDPDLYIEEIDWDPKIDPDLMKELDRDFFAPADEEAGVKNKLMRKYKRIRWSSGSGSHANPFGEVSPWECSESNNATQVGGASVNNGSESVVIGQSSLQGKASLGTNEVGNLRACSDGNDTSRVSDIAGNNTSNSVEIGLRAREVEASLANEIFENKNPWESSSNISKNTGIGQSAWIVRANDQWNQRNGHDHDDCNDENPWEQSKAGVVGLGKVNGWGRSCDKGWGWNQDEWNVDRSWAQSSSNNNNYNKNNRGWRDYGRDSRRGQLGRCNNNNNYSKDFDYGRRSNHHYGQVYYNNSNNYNNSNSSGYGRNESGYRNSRFFRGDENRTSGDCWEKRANNKRRISFD